MRLLKSTVHPSVSASEPRQFTRLTSRAIALKGTDILLMYTARYEDFSLPGGGIDEGEDIRSAAMRELTEETGVRSAAFLAETEDWLTYDLPDHLLGVAWKGRYRGQKQKWIACRFAGDDSEVDISGIGHKPEFDEWRWADINELEDLIVPFKRDVYSQVIAAFRHLTV